MIWDGVNHPNTPNPKPRQTAIGGRPYDPKNHFRPLFRSIRGAELLRKAFLKFLGYKGPPYAKFRKNGFLDPKNGQNKYFLTIFDELMLE